MSLSLTVSTASLWCICLIITVIHGDVYLHNPRGSNNRLNEQSANRNNAYRVFNSQNNNRGGYNVGVNTQDANGDPETEQYNMKYFQSSSLGESLLTVEWTNQHGCGGNEDTDPNILNCNLVIQYMCQDNNLHDSNITKIRNGANTGTQQYNQIQSLQETRSTFLKRMYSVQTTLVLQEPFAWYDKCYVKERNKGLFTADQVLQSNNLGYTGSIFTRQNPTGNQYGYECPEERDYYPYFHPSPWKDIVVMTDNTSLCSYYQNQSFNSVPKYECVQKFPAPDAQYRRPYSRFNNQQDCVNNSGTWTALYNYLEKDPTKTYAAACTGASGNGRTYIWQIPYDTTDGVTQECLLQLPQVDCVEAPWSRSNHLGNGRTPEPNNYTWVLPYFPSGNEKRCVLRFRYNVTTDDYDPFLTNASSNQNLAKGVWSPVQQNPLVEVGAGGSPLRLAINTAQYGRVFQDRSHVFLLSPRPSGIQNETLYNLNVRGKRGNIVQVYPAVEYDFVPNPLNLGPNDLVHIQWTGSNTHNNGDPAGDGQAGDAGEGRTGTDRSNMVETLSLNDNYPIPYENSRLFKNAMIRWAANNATVTNIDLAVSMATSGFFPSYSTAQAGLQVQLDNASPSFAGAILKLQSGAYTYIGTRNNNFSNRSQKGKITVR